VRTSNSTDQNIGVLKRDLIIFFKNKNNPMSLFAAEYYSYFLPANETSFIKAGLGSAVS
jgi:hypothetical protein